MYGQAAVFRTFPIIFIECIVFIHVPWTTWEAVSILSWLSLRNKVEMKYKNGCYPIYPSTKLGALGVCQSRRMQMISWHSVCFDTLKIQFTCVWNEV